MNYFEKTNYKKEQNRKDLTWEEVKNLPVYVMTNAGHLWRGDEEVAEEFIEEPCYIVRISSKPIALYFFEKATLKGMKGVKLHLTLKSFPKAKSFYDLALNDMGLGDRWVFITPDWKVYDMEGNQIEIKKLEYREQHSLSYCDFQSLRNYGHDLRMTGQFREGMCNSFSCELLLSPATVDILKEAGFDMDTPMATTWQIQSGYNCYDIPKDSYRTDWFVENLVHPNRVARRRKENSLIRHDYEYYHNLMGGENFLIFEEEGQVYIAQESDGYHNGITVSYLRMPGRKTPPCVFYSPRESKKLTDNSIKSVLDSKYNDALVKKAAENVINQLLNKKQLLEKTEVFRNLLPELEMAKTILNAGTLLLKDTTQRIYSNLSYILSPVGQKDRVLEETVKQNGLEKGISADRFLRIIGDSYLNPILKQKTPYGQVGLTKTAYYNLKRLIETGVSINFRALIKGLANGADSWRVSMTKEEYLAKRLECSPYLTADFFDLLKRTASVSYDSYGISWKGPSAASWGSLLRLAGKSLTSPLPEKIAAVTRLLKKLDSDASLSAVFEQDSLRDYYRQADELAPLGIDWPRRYEEFHVKNIMWFLGTIRGNSALVDRAKSLIPSSSFGQRVEILHEMQNQISALNKLEIEKAALQQMDKDYAPWKEQLKKALEWKGENLGIFIPESLAELTMEGKILHHCVGSYKKDVALRKEGILFLRKLSCPGMPYYTLDVVKDPSGKYTVRQCHGNCNSNPTPEVIEALKKWAADTGKVDENSIKDAYGTLCCL